MHPSATSSTVSQGWFLRGAASGTGTTAINYGLLISRRSFKRGDLIAGRSFPGDPSAWLIKLPIRASVHRSVRMHMHMHGCMHAAGMPVYAGGMRNIEYRMKLRRTAQEQLGFSISSSRSSKYAQSAHTAQKNATHACLATAHFWAPPCMAM